jgi:hypothetical protein
VSTFTHHQGLPVGTPVFGGDRFVRGCTGKQAAFINRLLDERDHTLPYNRAEDINIKHASRVIEHLLSLPVKENAVLRLASDRQVSYILSLAAGRQGGAETLAMVNLGCLGFSEASTLIETLKALPLPVPEALTVGAYMHDGVVYSVRKSPESGRLHAYQFVNGKWQYVRMVAQIKASERLTLEQAKQFGAMTGVCVHCGRTLTDPKSVTAGIGPVCAKNY